ncbi:MAG: acetyltransferase [Oscillatoriales cyanobacterium RM2_1_1]|nr:acetyltransferase [Oscillatoriales cyanobacterium SM2_3_0]NJO47962.1 acetyltransferase [Oscillatoriales cyanobacterium RM2_1_1]
MLLKYKKSGNLIEVSDVLMLIDPNQSQIWGQPQAGEEEQPPEPIEKTQLMFPSGEDLPQCWLNANYQKA